MGLGRLNELDAVTLDAYGTLVELEDPVPRLQSAFGISADAAKHGLKAELAYYGEHVLEGRDAESLAVLRARCASVFAEGSGSIADATAFQSCLVFVPLPGIGDALRRLRAYGLGLTVVSNWDFGLHEHLRRLGARVDAVVTSAEVGVRKQDPRVFLRALELLGVAPERALHVGDHAELASAGAEAAGMRFASSPLTGVLA